ncbi:Organic cation transporter protein [Lamellibrachia satsuma]|nr:Organic cation transporter protein [Lamellibrachia satsuma]
MSQFDEVLDELGSFGPFQLRLFLVVSLFETPAAWAMFLPVFIAAKPTWRCPVPSSDDFSYNIDMLNTTINKTMKYTENSCTESNTVCTGIEYTSNFTSIVSEWDLICDRGHLRFTITTIQMVGTLIGACVTGQLADMYGRRRVLYTVYVLLLAAGLGSAFSSSWQMFTIFRFFVGAFFGGTMVVNFVMPLEFVGRRWRTFCGCIGFWALGVMLLAPMAFFIPQWRHLTAICSISGLVLMATWWYVPESPRWLIQKGRITEAKVIITRIAEFNRKPPPDLTKHGSCLIKEEQERKVENYSYWHLFRTPTLAKNSLIIIFAWFVSSSVYYGTSLNVGSLSGDRYVNFFLSGLVEIPALLFVVFVNNRIGRRWTLSILMMVAGASCFGILFLDITGKVEEHGAVMTGMALLGKAGIAGGWAAAQVFSAEVFPTVVRNIGIAASSMAARLGGIAAPQLIFLGEFSRPLPYVIFGVLGIVCALLTFLLPETFNQPLPDRLPPLARLTCCQAQHELQQTANARRNSVTSDGNPDTSQLSHF